MKSVEFDYILDLFLRNPSELRLQMYKGDKWLDLKRILRGLQTMRECSFKARVVRYRDRKVLWPRRGA